MRCRFSHTLANGYFDNWYVTAFLEAMLQELTGRFVVVWDGGRMHKGDPIRALVDHFADRLALEKLPPYAPMLNPVESLWSWLKWERLSNFGPQDAHELDARVIAELTAVREDQAFLRNLFHASDLPLPRALLFCLSIGRSAEMPRGGRRRGVILGKMLVKSANARPPAGRF